MFEITISDDEWNKRIRDFFGPLGSSMATPDKSVEECIGFAREMLYGKDEYKDQRRPIGLIDIPELFPGDTLPYLHLKYNLLNIPPSVRNSFDNAAINQRMRQMYAELHNPIYN